MSDPGWTVPVHRPDTALVLPDHVPSLEHDPVRLRAWRDTDVDLFLSAVSDPLVRLSPDGSPATFDAFLDRQQRRLSERSGYCFAIVDKSTEEALGNVGLWTGDIATGRATLYFWISSRSRRRGYATAALRAVTAWALTMPEVDRLDMFVQPSNEASWRAAEAAGYLREGLLRSWQRIGDARTDMFVYSILPVR